MPTYCPFILQFSFERSEIDTSTWLRSENCQEEDFLECKKWMLKKDSSKVWDDKDENVIVKCSKLK